MDTEIATCHNCGFPVTSGARFCQNCGVDVSQEQGMMPTMSVGPVPSRKTVAEATLELLRRETLGEYEILGELGRGGMATVYLAHHIALDRKVAIKVMTPSLMDEGLAERFRREAKTAAALNHPHIIPIYGVYERSSLIYFVMKFVAGQSLDPIVKQHGPLPIKMARTVLAQAASALGYAHRRGVVHRDVKPANIMLDDEGWVVMTDFGIAKAPSATGLTLTGVTVGTPAYMSPEQCLGKEVTGASDQYSLGVVAYELLTGKKPFTATTAMAMMYAHFNEEAKPLRELRPEIPEDLEISVHRMLAKDAEHRWPRIDDAFGTPVLAHDDPIREQLIRFAQASPNATMAARISTPTSPIPPARRTSTRLPVNPSTTEAVLPAAARVDPPTEAMPHAEAPPTAVPPAPEPAATEAMPVAGLVPAVGSAAPPAAGPAPASQLPAAPAAADPTPSVEAVSVPASARPSTHIPVARATTPTVLGARPARTRVVPIMWGLVAVAAVAVGVVVARRSPRTSDAPVGPARPDTTHPVQGGGAPNGATGAGLSDSSHPRPPDTSAATPREAPVKPPATVAVARIEIPQGSQTVDVGRSVSLDARLLGADGRPLPDRRPLTWATSASAVATVDANGMVRGVAPGKATITASAEGVKGSVQVAVRLPAAVPPVTGPVAAIRVQPESSSVGLGQELGLTAAVQDARGNVLADRPLAWASSDETVATVSPAGRVTGHAPGLARISVRSGTVSRTVLITVLPEAVATVRLQGAPAGALKPGEVVDLNAVAVGASGSPLTGRKTAWSSSDDAVASVQGGRVTAHAAGTATITVAVEGRSASTSLTVAAAGPLPSASTVPPADPAADRGKATAEIRRQLDAYASAITARDLARLKAAYPGMSATDERNWKASFAEKSISRMAATLEDVGSPQFDRDAAEVRFQLRMEIEVSGSPVQKRSTNYVASFELSDGRWQLMRLKAR
jgi:serine/threonine-protein kinase